MSRKFPFGKKSIVITVTIILIISISLTIRPKENPNFFEKGLNFLFSPVQMIVKWPFDRIAGSIEFFSNMKYYAEENAKLTAENTKLKEENRQLISAQIENENLKDMLNLKKKYEMSGAITADIIAREPEIWFNSFLVNKGIKDGIKKDMVVLTPNGLVGKISQVFDNSSKVITILDVDNAVSARLTKTGDQFATKGDMNLVDKQLLKAILVTSEIPLASGDVVETLGVGPIYPKGIFIGTIAEVEQDETLKNRFATIKPGVDFNKITEVLIIENTQAE